MIAAAIVCAAAFSQAAVVSWDMDASYKAGTSQGAGNYAVYFLTSLNYDYDSAVSDVKNGDLAFLSNAPKTSGGTGSQFVLTESDGYAEGSRMGTFADQDVSTKAYLVILDASTLDGAKNAYITTTTKDLSFTSAGAASPSTVHFGNQTATKDAGNWYAVVPEPTSGLLLLIGVAGLALKRRRA